MSLKLFRAIKYGNSFLPIASGIITEDKNKQKIEITLRLNYFVMVFSMMWLLTVLIVIIFMFLSEKISLASLISVGMLAFGYLLMQLAFWIEAPKIKKIINDIVNGQ